MAQDYDIGVYFEANGHGTVIFSSEATAAVTGAAMRYSEYLCLPLDQSLSLPERKSPRQHSSNVRTARMPTTA